MRFAAVVLLAPAAVAAPTSALLYRESGRGLYEATLTAALTESDSQGVARCTAALDGEDKVVGVTGSGPHGYLAAFNGSNGLAPRAWGTSEGATHRHQDSR
ncbi:hypothetical protein [Allokutzneria oryzae]|uniref:Uncharacterized protein n=1 Tax=Allokutzneria oryzae TaxID=1378989 RepID=A0ABV6A1K6_9PSEU